jgi:hypothetical protein
MSEVELELRRWEDEGGALFVEVFPVQVLCTLTMGAVRISDGVIEVEVVD